MVNIIFSIKRLVELKARNLTLDVASGSGRAVSILAFFEKSIGMWVIIFLCFFNEFCKNVFIQGIHCTVHPGNIHCKWDYYSGGTGFWNGKFYNTDTTAHSAYNNFLGCKSTIDRIIFGKRARCKWKLFFLISS